VDGRTSAGACGDVAPARDGARSARLAGLRRWGLDRRTLVFAALGPLADIDFLLGIHSRQTHSLGATLIVFVLILAWASVRAAPSGPARTSAAARFRWAVACAAAYGSHVLFDWMGNDTTPPIGIMALWPFSNAFYQSNLFVFEAISRRWWLAGFWTHNLLAVAREVLIVLPLVLVVGYWRRPRTPDR
jgi:hypothetical protein